MTLHFTRNLVTVNAILDRFSPVVLAGLMIIGAFRKYVVLTSSSGGDDLLYSDIPKSLMLLRGQNPYLVNPWRSPYPLFLFVVLDGIMWTASGGEVLSGTSIGVLSWDIRVAGLLADLCVGGLIFLVLRLRGLSGLQVLVPVGLYLLLDPVALLPYVIFHVDAFGYLILAVSILALVMDRFLLGTMLLSVSVVFKVHPILALLLLLVWIARRHGITMALPSFVSSGVILVVGLAMPLWIPGYTGSFFGYNLSTGFGNGTASYSLLNFFYAVLPVSVGLALPISTVNVIWLAATASLFAFALRWVWVHAGRVGPIEVVLLGLLVWLLPLRELYPWYVAWALIPFLMRASLVESVLAGAFLELAYVIGGLLFNPQGSPFPLIGSVYGFFLTSLLYAAFNIIAMTSILRRYVRHKNCPGSIVN